MSASITRWMMNQQPADFDKIILLCGATAFFDEGSGCSYRCDYCFATVGSMGMPSSCKELYDMQEVVNKLKGVV